MIGFTLLSLVLPGYELLPDRPDFANFLSVMCVFVTLPTVGAVLAILRPGNPIGWLFLIVALGFIIGVFSTEYVSRSTILGADLPAHAAVDWVGAWSGTLAIGLAGAWIPLLFPDGHLPGPRWRPVAWASAVSLVLMVVASAVVADGRMVNPVRLAPALEELAQVILSLPMFAVFGLLGFAGLLARFRRSRGIERQQLKWFLAAVGFLVVAVIVAIATEWATAWYAVILGLAALPIAAAVAILRYRLYEIDRLVSRTIGWTLVTGALGAVFALTVIALQALLAGFTQGQTLAVAASTLVAFALFQPLRRRVQRIVDRRFNRAQYNAQRTADAFAEQLRNEVDLPLLSGSLVRVVDGAVAPRTAAVWLRPGGSR
jgi:MFS family permease